MSRVFYAGFSAKCDPVRVRFGKGSRYELAGDLKALGMNRALVLTTPEQTEQGAQIADQLGAVVVGQFNQARMHTPVEVTENALAAARDLNADGVIAIGGGSTIGLGKAIAYHTDLKQIVLPTTYAGSEATAVLGQTEDGVKTTLRDVKVQPEAIIYDPELVASLPLSMTITSGLNAMAHAAEGLYASDATPLSTALAMEGIRAFVSGLPKVVEAPEDLAAREATLFGAYLCGTVLNLVGMALHHKLCHTLGGSLNLPHAETHAIILPHAVAYNETPALRPLADLLGSSTAGEGLYDFATSLGAPRALKDIGVDQSSLDKIAELAANAPYPNPRQITREGIRELLQLAYHGQRPKGD